MTWLQTRIRTIIIREMGGWGANAKRDPGFYKQNAWIKEVLGKGLKCKCLLPTSQDELLIEFSANTCVPYQKSDSNIQIQPSMQKSIHTVLGFLSQCSQTQKMKTDIAFAIRKQVISCLSNVRTLHLKTDTIKFNKPSVHTFSNLK